MRESSAKRGGIGLACAEGVVAAQPSAPRPATVPYERRRPDKSTLHRIVRDNLQPGTLYGGYFDPFYPGFKEEAADGWRRSFLPGVSHPSWVRDADTDEVIRRWPYSGLCLHRPGGVTIPMFASTLANKATGLGLDFWRFDNFAPNIGWNFTDRQGIRHDRLRWQGKVFVATGTDWIADDGSSLVATYEKSTCAIVTAMRVAMPKPTRLIVSSGIKWLSAPEKPWINEAAALLDGRLQEGGFVPASFVGEPYNTAEGWPMVMCTTSTWPRLKAMMGMPANVVIVEDRDLGFTLSA